MLAIFGEGQVLWAFLVFFFWIIWILLAIAVFIDIFRSPDLSGPAKALWVLVVLLLPYIGVFIYLLIRGGQMYEHAVEHADAEDRAFRERMRQMDESGNDRMPPRS